MATCAHCGMTVLDGAKFCRECGAPLSASQSDGQREQLAGAVKKCPNCGEALKFSDSRCPSCGWEVRGVDAANSVNRIAFQLERIEAESPTGIEADHRKAEFIRNFAVPNTREDMFEFMVLATTNVDTDLMACKTAEKARMNPVAFESKMALSKAWLAKAEQVYQKAQFLLDPEDFAWIKQIYESELSKVSDIKYLSEETQKSEKIRRGKIFPYVPTWAIVIVVIVLCLIWQGIITANMSTTVQGTGDLIIIALGVAYGFLRNDR